MTQVLEAIGSDTNDAVTTTEQDDKTPKHIRNEQRLIHLFLRYDDALAGLAAAPVDVFDGVHQPLMAAIHKLHASRLTREYYRSTFLTSRNTKGLHLAMTVYDKCQFTKDWTTLDDLPYLTNEVRKMYVHRCHSKVIEEFRASDKSDPEAACREMADKMTKALDILESEPAIATALKVKTLRAEDEESIAWLWHKRFALGKLGIIAGEPGQGKGLISCYIASRVTTGEPFVDAEQPTSKGDVLFLSAEDNYRDTIIPRLIVAGADLDGGHVHVVESVSTSEGDGKCVDLNRDIPALEAHLQRHPNIRLIIIDPLSAYMGKVNSWQDTQVRSILQPLCKMAENHNVAVIGVMHLNKDEKKKSAVNRAAGSIGFIGAARTAWLVCDDRYDNSKMFLCIKTNVSARPGGLGYEVGVDGDRPYVVWKAGELAVTADEALQEAKAPQAKEAAREWLLDLLGDGQVKSQEVYDAADTAGIAARTLKRAKADLNVIAKKEGSVWYWSLPKGAESTNGPLAF